MPLPMLGAAMHTAATGLAIAAGAFIAGTMLLRWYRMRQEFLLLRLALEKGIAPLPPSQPQWLISLRQGVMILTLGVGIALAGAIGWKLASDVDRPVVSSAMTIPDSEILPPEPPVAEPPGPGRGGAREGRPRPPAPRPPDPAFDEWRRAQDQLSACMAMTAGGVILILLGIARLAFVPAERRFSDQIEKVISQRNSAA